MKFTSLAFLLLAISFAYASSPTTGDVNDVMNTPYYQKMLRTALEEINQKNSSQKVILLVDGITNVNSITVKIESASLVQIVHFNLDVTDEQGYVYVVELDVYAQPLRNSQRVEDYSVIKRHHGSHHHLRHSGDYY